MGQIRPLIKPEVFGSSVDKTKPKQRKIITKLAQTHISHLLVTTFRKPV